MSDCVSCELLHINWNGPQAAVYTKQAAFERDLSTSWWMQTELPRCPQGQSRANWSVVTTLKIAGTI